MPEASQLVDVLLVDDSEQDGELALRVLRQHPLCRNVAWARDGAEALAFIFGDGFGDGALSLVPRVILLDIKLPKLDGHQVLKTLRADPRTRRIPVVMMTSSMQERDIEEAYAHGANSFIVKPVNFDGLTEVVSQVGTYWLQLNQPPRLP